MLRMFASLTAIVAVGLINQACSTKPQAEKSCNFVQNSELQRVSWGSNVPVVLDIDSSVPNEFYDDIKQAAKTWNAQVGREVLKIGSYVDTKADPAQDGHNIIYYMHTWEDDRTNEQARTTVYWAGDRIYEADVRINARDFAFSSGSNLEANKIDMQSLILHEFGHVLGLAHSVAPASVMARSLPNDYERRDLSSGDLDSIRCEY